MTRIRGSPASLEKVGYHVWEPRGEELQGFSEPWVFPAWNQQESRNLSPTSEEHNLVNNHMSLEEATELQK